MRLVHHAPSGRREPRARSALEHGLRRGLWRRGADQARAALLLARLLHLVAAPIRKAAYGVLLVDVGKEAMLKLIPLLAPLFLVGVVVVVLSAGLVLLHL